MINITNEDNMELMSRYDDNYFELAIVDPPYGIDIAKWDKKELKPTKEYFKELFRVSKNQIIWGGNYFTNNLIETRSWLVWDKYFVKTGFAKNVDEFELAWTSFNNKSKILRYTSVGNTNGFNKNIKVDYNYKGKIHPTQKPVKLYEWLLMNYAKEGGKILDTHLGSGSIAIACHNLGYDLTACELDKEYYEAAIKRLKEHTAQLRII
jgi:site-specific DNA-methyltransferase (adenine-specific)